MGNVSRSKVQLLLDSLDKTFYGIKLLKTMKKKVNKCLVSVSWRNHVKWKRIAHFALKPATSYNLRILRQSWSSWQDLEITSGRTVGWKKGCRDSKTQSDIWQKYLNKKFWTSHLLFMELKRWERFRNYKIS